MTKIFPTLTIELGTLADLKEQVRLRKRVQERAKIHTKYFTFRKSSNSKKPFVLYVFELPL